jgi:two-component system sensor histidine kinase KdpD
MVDQTPEALRKRLRHGNVQPAEQVQRALDGFFRVDTLTALRDLALQRMAQHNAQNLSEHSRRGGADTPLPSVETVLVCLPANDLAQTLVRRGVLLAQRLRARLVVVHIAQSNRHPLSGGSTDQQETVKALQLARALGADVLTPSGSNVAQTLAEYASELRATQIVMGESSHSWPRELLQGSILRDVLGRIKNVDVYIVRRADARV